MQIYDTMSVNILNKNIYKGYLRSFQKAYYIIFSLILHPVYVMRYYGNFCSSRHDIDYIRHLMPHIDLPYPVIKSKTYNKKHTLLCVFFTEVL